MVMFVDNQKPGYDYEKYFYLLLLLKSPNYPMLYRRIFVYLKL
ncbi:hypothetical protein SAMN04487908_13319 [Aequorivita viscosa]|uniref:Uncharacterized protein n=1 Tax=Aequorivita viscosa TaxID=797419 RepID=A0A1M6NCZ3_9FLAO|nr:hypothetical protein SAMN04487908_13319 [Aequorivita viscosa]